MAGGMRNTGACYSIGASVAIWTCGKCGGCFFFLVSFLVHVLFCTYVEYMLIQLLLSFVALIELGLVWVPFACTCVVVHR